MLKIRTLVIASVTVGSLGLTLTALAGFVGPTFGPPGGNALGVFYVMPDASFTPITPEVDKNLMVPGGIRVGKDLFVTGKTTIGGSTAVSGDTTISRSGDVNYLVLNTTSATNKRTRLDFSQNGVLGMEIGTDYGLSNVQDLYIYNRSGGNNVAIFKGTGNTEIGPGTNPQVRLSVGGDGLYYGGRNDLWVERDAYVQGYENDYLGGKSRLRIGSAWNKPGIYAERNSNNAASDLVLGASSDYVHINAGTFGNAGAVSQLALAGSRIGDFGAGNLVLNSGGNLISTGGDDSLTVYQNLNVGQTVTTQNLNAWGTITSNYFVNSYNLWAYNGGTTNQQGPSANNICTLAQEERYGDGKCLSWTAGGYWFFQVWSANSLACRWDCYKYR